MNGQSFLLAAAIALIALPAGAQQQPPDRLEKILHDGVLRVGTTMDTPVFSMRDPATGKLQGFDMDALEALGSALGVKIEYVKMTFGSVVADLAADKFDIAMSGMGRTFERARSATFSKPYMRYGRLMMVRSADKGRFKSLADLDRPGIKIGYNKGGVNDRFANAMFKQATPTGFDSNELATADLLAGKIDALVSNSAAAIYTASQPAPRGDEPRKHLQPDLRGDTAAARRPNAAQFYQYLDRPDRHGRHSGENPCQVAGRYEVAARAGKRSHPPRR